MAASILVYTCRVKTTFCEVDPIQATLHAVSRMSFETWVSILLAALGVLLVMVTLFVALAGLVIATLGIFGIKELRRSVKNRAEEVVSNTIAKYPQSDDLLDLYRKLQAQLEDFKREYGVWQKRSEEASAILSYLSANGNPIASNTSVGEVDEGHDDKAEGAISASYPGKEDSSDNHDGKPSNNDSDSSTDTR